MSALAHETFEFSRDLMGRIGASAEVAQWHVHCAAREDPEPVCDKEGW